MLTQNYEYDALDATREGFLGTYQIGLGEQSLIPSLGFGPALLRTDEHTATIMQHLPVTRECLSLFL